MSTFAKTEIYLLGFVDQERERERELFKERLIHKLKDYKFHRSFAVEIIEF